MSVLATTKMSSRGQVVVPEPIRDQMGLKAGDRFVVLAYNGTVLLKKSDHP